MTQQSTNQTFFRQANQIENANPANMNSVEFVSGQVPNLPANPKRIWVDQVSETMKFTVDGVDIHTLSDRADGVGNPYFYGAIGNGIADDTSAIQQTLNNFKIVDLQGLNYKTSALTLNSGQTLRNGTLTTSSVVTVLTGNGTNNVTIQNVEITGSNTSETAIFIQNATNVTIDRCNIHNFKTISTATVGVYLKTCTFSQITRCNINNIVGVPNSIIGDGNGASRAVILERCTTTRVDGCKINNILSTDDGDGIHCIDLTAGQDTTIDALNVISGCTITSCDRSHIKLQQSGVFVFNNDFLSDVNQLANNDNAIRVYGSNIRIEENRIECNTQSPIMIGNSLNPTLANITIMNNCVTYNGTSFQGCVVMNTSPVIENVLIQGNTFAPISPTTEQGVYIRTYAKNVRVIGNKMVNVVNAVYIRNISGITPISGSVRERIIISENDCNVVNNLVNEESGTIYDGLVVTSNNLNITTPLAFAQNSVRLDATQYNNNPVIIGNRIKNAGFDDGVKKNGSTSIRPTAGMTIGFEYYDTTLQKPIWWNGTVWKDAAGTTV